MSKKQTAKAWKAHSFVSLRSPRFAVKDTFVYRMQAAQFRKLVHQELTQNILPFYVNHAVDQEHGGFYGRIDNDNTIYPQAPKGQIQHSRLLWTFARAARTLKQSAYQQLAANTYHFLQDHFWDTTQGGYFAQVAPEGRPLQTDKLIYGQAFGVYGLAEYFLLTGKEAVRERAVTLFHLLEKQATDRQHSGYFEAFTGDWQHRLRINIDLAAPQTAKTMNTHLHLLEAYTNLLCAWPDDVVRHALHQLIRLHLDQIIDQSSGHLRLHFTADWTPLNNHISFGHDIEASWLLLEAAELLGEPALLKEVTAVSLHIAQVALRDGLLPSGGLRDEPDTTDVTWWPQAEALVGFINAYQQTQEIVYWQTAVQQWQVIQEQLVDHTNGDWFEARAADGTLLSSQKAGYWKTPYHNGRACMELMHRLEQIET